MATKETKSKLNNNNNNKMNRPLFPNHNKKIKDIQEQQKGRGICGYSSDVVQYADELGMKMPVVTCAQRDNKYSSPNIYGVELEVCTDLNSSKMYESTSYPFFFLKEDSSISGEGLYRCEIVTVPMSMKAHKILWAELFQNISDKSDTSVENTNGTHIHVSRENFIDSHHKKNFIWFFNHPAHAGYLLDISERETYEQMVRYSRFCMNDPSNGTFIDSENTKASLFKNIERKVHTRESIVNTQKPKTLEVRLFKGVVSFSSLLKNIEFVDSVLEFTKERSAVQIIWPRYIQWLEKETQKNQYKTLKEFLKTFIDENSHEEFRMIQGIFKKGNIKNIDEKLTFKLDTDRTWLRSRFGHMRGVSFTNTEMVIDTSFNKAKMSHFDKSLAALYTSHFVQNS
jgi:hypothetical protein